VPVASTTARPAPKKNNSKFITKKPPVRPSMVKNRNKNCPKPVEPPQNYLNKATQGNSHPSDCACPQCDKCIGMQGVFHIHTLINFSKLTVFSNLNSNDHFKFKYF